MNAPISRPSGYNTTLYPITVDLYLDPECRYTISATNSFGQTASRIFLQFSHWIPAHLVAILLLAFRYQIKITPEKEIFKCGSLNAALLAGQTFFIITGILFKKMFFIEIFLWFSSSLFQHPVWQCM